MDQEANNNPGEVSHEVALPHEAARAIAGVISDDVDRALENSKRAMANAVILVETRTRGHVLGTLRFPAYGLQASEAARLESFNVWPKGMKHLHSNLM